jgi:hypothetical protein
LLFQNDSQPIRTNNLNLGTEGTKLQRSKRKARVTNDNIEAGARILNDAITWKSASSYRPPKKMNLKVAKGKQLAVWERKKNIASS